MDRLTRAFDALRRARRKALIPFLVGGFPQPSLTGPLLVALQEAGADAIEVGIPFSDPLADGPTIQRASAQALARGTTPPTILAAIASVRARLRVPVLCLTYVNPMLQFGGSRRGGGLSAFFRAAAASGISGVIAPDVPVEAAAELRAAAASSGVATVFLAAPTSPPDRLRLIARASQGFIYYVSVTGTTGARRRLPPTLVHGIRQLRVVTTKPICVGFGISTPAQAARVARLADGVIVGSALVQVIATARRAPHAVRAAAGFVARLRKGL